MKIPHRAGMILILLFAAGSVIADSMFRLLSMIYDGVFAGLIVAVVMNMSAKTNNEDEDKNGK